MVKWWQQKQSNRHKLRQWLGHWHEHKASWFLRSKGYKIIARNLHCFYGEIDIIASKKTVIVFIEVRYRQKNALVDGLSSIDEKKQRRIILTASFFLKKNKQYHPYQCRFDVVAFNGRKIYWIKNAFSVQ